MRYVTVFIIGLAHALALCPVARAGILPEFNTVSVRPGELLEQAIAVDRTSGKRLEIKLVSPPDGAHITVSDDGQLRLQWETGPDLPAQTQLTIQARDIDTQSVVESRVLQISNVSGDNRRYIGVSPDTTVTLGPMANQIISGGQAISVPVNATSSDDEEPLITIDRVPRNAAFEKNLVRGYTFYWQTSDSDEGEHIFRVTARHPSESSVTATALLTVFVGDPSLRTTRPVEQGK